MDYQPPPFFKRGPAPLAQLSFYVALSLALIFVDSRFQTLELARQAVSLVTHPVQHAVQKPVELVQSAGAYLYGMAAFEEENARLKREQLENAERLLRTRQLEAENERLRSLLEMKQREKISGRIAQIVYAARDPFSRRLVVDKGLQDKIAAGQPVVDESGVVGQVTRAFPFVSEVMLITDKAQAVPVQIVRNGLRSVVFGLGNGQLELRYLPANADVQDGDLLVTSGLDGIFPSGLPVARVVRIERDASYTFARIHCTPVAAVENFAEVMVLDAREPLTLPSALSTKAVEGRGRRDAGIPLGKKKRPRRE